MDEQKDQLSRSFGLQMKFWEVFQNFVYTYNQVVTILFIFLQFVTNIPSSKSLAQFVGIIHQYAFLLGKVTPENFDFGAPTIKIYFTRVEVRNSNYNWT